MDVVFAINGDFARYAAVAIVSLLKSTTTEVTIHILCMGVSEGDIEKLCSLSKAHGGEVKVYRLGEDCLRGLSDPGHYSWATYLRLLVASVLDERISKVLYLDSDLVVAGNVDRLWAVDVSGFSLAAVHDTTLSYQIIESYIGYDFRREGYFNAGVLLINLDYWRKHGVQEQLIDYLKAHDVRLNDQDALNAVLHGTVKFVHPRWNCHTGFFSLPPLVVGEQRRYIKEMWRGARIAHFTGPAKPWYRECVNPYKRVYLKYKRMTPWCNVPQRQLEGNAFRSVAIVVLRHCKNIMARLLSYTYR